MDEVLDAEIVEENLFSLIPKYPSFLWVKIESLVLKHKKLMILMSTILVTSIIVSSTIWSAAGPGGFSKSDYEWWETPVNERYNMELNMTGWRSQLPVEG
ncbi:MAG: hypothetical protein P8Q96_04940, partial [Candidatus Thalassarchaeaceae archaeon]|nr:hypothetical protein [Candidatus Thalassarchaeaceae archaeon]